MSSSDDDYYPSSHKQDHYRVLGVRRDATIEEIKASFRKLCKEYHPDVNAGQKLSNKNNDASDFDKDKIAQAKAKSDRQQERFKQITVAAGVLTNATKRQRYDSELSYGAGMFHQSDGFDTNTSFSHARRAARQQQQTRSGLHGFLNIMFRPRNLFFVGPIVFFTSVSVIQYLAGIKKNDKYDTMEESRVQMYRSAMLKNINDHNELKDDPHEIVQAWMNPLTRRYETPAPWDPTYQKLKPSLIYMTKDQVTSVEPPPSRTSARNTQL